jgi:hypothetical protein
MRCCGHRGIHATRSRAFAAREIHDDVEYPARGDRHDADGLAIVMIDEVQRGTIHNWINRGTVPCVMAFALIGAKPVEVGGKVLRATG